jgi:hypothetical protein
MIDPLLRALAPLAPAVHDMQGVAALVRAISPLVGTLRVRDGDLPWGRYLLHLAPDASWNLQLDVFSEGYEGGVHAHGTWGAFWVLRGALWTEQLTMGPNGARLSGAGFVTPGGCGAFCPPESDWHRVGSPAQGEQTVSLHLYGRGFDLDVGEGIGPDGLPRRYARSPWGAPSRVLGAVVAR